jgi:hypothetical protein
MLQDVTQWNAVDSSQPFEGNWSPPLQAFREDEGSRFFRFVGKYLPNYTMSHLRRHNVHKVFPIYIYMQTKKRCWVGVFLIQITTE